MTKLGWLFLSILGAYGCALMTALLRLRLRGKPGAVAGYCLVPIILICPLLIPAEKVGLRAISVFASGDLVFKIIDFFRVWGGVNRSVLFREYCLFLIPFPALLGVYPEHNRRLRPRVSPWPEILRVGGGGAGCAAAIIALKVVNTFPMIQSSFAINHAVMLVTFVLAIESISRVLYGLERLAGYDTTPIIQNAYVSRTVSEFWRRYNNRIHAWLYRNVFQVAGGRRSPVRSVLLAFFVSGLFHETTFAIATSKLTGYQLAFFTIQGPAALLSGRLERIARRGGLAGKIAAHAFTIIFVGATSVLFFDGVNMIFPFIYSSRSPLR